jgi:hypothetical protein
VLGVCGAGVATQLDECRLWLRGTQGFVLQLQKQVQGYADDGQPSTAGLDTGYSVQDGGCSTSTAPNSAASLNAWRVMCQEASDALGGVAETMDAGGAEVRLGGRCVPVDCGSPCGSRSSSSWSGSSWYMDA